MGLPLVALSTAAGLFLRRKPKGALALPLFVAGYLLRGYGLFHPSTFYGDVANARDYVEVFRETTGSLAARGVETQTKTNVGYPRNVAGKDYAFPYSPLYFLPFGFARTPGGIEDAVRHAGLAASALETLPIFWLASTIFSPPAGVLASLLWIFSPPVFSRLLLALHATVVGNLLDTLAIACVLALSSSSFGLGGFRRSRSQPPRLHLEPLLDGRVLSLRVAPGAEACVEAPRSHCDRRHPDRDLAVLAVPNRVLR
jgi:hypothetical protein